MIHYEVEKLFTIVNMNHQLYNIIHKLNIKDMSLEEQLHIAMTHRAILAAAVVGTMVSPCVSEESIRIKNAIMRVILGIFDDGERFGDSIERHLLLSSKNHCIEQIEINELLEGIR